jgi:hypothetical protein
MLVSFNTNPQMKCWSHNLKPYFIFKKYEILLSYATSKPCRILK